MRVVSGTFAANVNFVSRQRQVDLYLERRSVASMSRRSFDDDVAAGDVSMEPFQVPDVFAHSSCYCGR